VLQRKSRKRAVHAVYNGAVDPIVRDRHWKTFFDVSKRTGADENDDNVFDFSSTKYHNAPHV